MMNHAKEYSAPWISWMNMMNMMNIMNHARAFLTCEAGGKKSTRNIAFCLHSRNPTMRFIIWWIVGEAEGLLLYKEYSVLPHTSKILQFTRQHMQFSCLTRDSRVIWWIIWWIHHMMNRATCISHTHTYLEGNKGHDTSRTCLKGEKKHVTHFRLNGVTSFFFPLERYEWLFSFNHAAYISHIHTYLEKKKLHDSTSTYLKGEKEGRDSCQTERKEWRDLFLTHFIFITHTWVTYTHFTSDSYSVTLHSRIWKKERSNVTHFGLIFFSWLIHESPILILWVTLIFPLSKMSHVTPFFPASAWVKSHVTHFWPSNVWVCDVYVAWLFIERSHVTRKWRFDVDVTHCNTLQHTATHCNTLQHTTMTFWRWCYTDICVILNTHCNTLQHTATRCNTLQHTATHCNTLRHAATHCNTLQHTVTHSNDFLTLMLHWYMCHS